MSSLAIRPITDADAQPCGRILFEAFRRFHDHHRFPPDFQSLEEAVQLAELFIGHPAIFGVVAEMDGQSSAPTSWTSAMTCAAWGRSPWTPTCRGRAWGVV